MRLKEYTLDDGTCITARELAEAAGISRESARERLQRSRCRERLMTPGRPYREERVYRQSGKAYTAKEICARVPGIALASAGYRGLKWERGEITEEEMFWPSGKKKERQQGDCNNKGNAEWRALGSKPRNLALARIKGAGRWEVKQVEGGTV